MTQQVANDHQVNPGGDKPAREGVPKIAESEVLDPRSGRSFSSVVVEIFDRATRRVGEDPGISVDVHRQFRQHSDCSIVQRDVPIALPLRFCAWDRRDALSEIHFAPSQTQSLSFPHAGVQRETDNPEELGVAHLLEQSHFLLLSEIAYPVVVGLERLIFLAGL